MDFFRARVFGAVAYSSLLDFSNAGWYTDNDSARRKPRWMDFLNQRAEHSFRNFEIGNNPVFHRTDCLNITMRSSNHSLRLAAECDDFLRGRIEGNNGRLIEHNALALHIDQGVCRAQIDCDVRAK